MLGNLNIEYWTKDYSNNSTEYLSKFGPGKQKAWHLEDKREREEKYCEYYHEMPLFRYDREASEALYNIKLLECKILWKFEFGCF